MPNTPKTKSPFKTVHPNLESYTPSRHLKLRISQITFLIPLLLPKFASLHDFSLSSASDPTLYSAAQASKLWNYSWLLSFFTVPQPINWRVLQAFCSKYVLTVATCHHFYLVILLQTTASSYCYTWSPHFYLPSCNLFTHKS